VKRVFQSIAVAVLTTLLVINAKAFADTSTIKTEIETFMNGYLDLWNAHDAKAIAARIYRLPASHPWATEEGLRAEFDRLKSQGYDRSAIASVIGCATGDNAGQVELRFTRLKNDGSFMPPKERVSLYQVTRFADGWRVTGMKALGVGEKMDCPG
jgi:hypothetical protein